MSGIADTYVIDVVAADAAGDTLLLMVETRPWGVDAQQSLQLREKVNTYVTYIVDGSLHRTYPETIDRPVHIQLHCEEPPSHEIQIIIDYTARKLREVGIGFRVHVRQ